jgi:hypothetical protein
MDALLVNSPEPKLLIRDTPDSLLVAADTAPPVPASDPIEDIRVRAETVSSVLRDIINQPSMRHWGINE